MKIIWITLLVITTSTAQDKEKQALTNSTKLEPQTKTEVPKSPKSPELQEQEKSKERKEKRGFLDFSYHGDKFDHGYYPDLHIPEATTPSIYPYPEFFPTTPNPQVLLQPSLHETGSKGPIDLGQSTTIEKTITLYKGIPVPYPVIKHVAIPVEKHIHVPVKVPVPAPYPVETTVHVPVQVPVKVPVPVPQPYPVNKYIPVKVYVDKPYPVYVPGGTHLPLPIDPCTDHKLGHLQPGITHLHDGYSWKPEDIPWGHSENDSEEEIDEPVFYDRLPDDLPEFVTLEKPTSDFYSASSNVNNYSKNKLMGFRKSQKPKRSEGPQKRKRFEGPQKPIRFEGPKIPQRQRPHSMNRNHDPDREVHDHHNERHRNSRHNYNNNERITYNNHRDLRNQYRKYEDGDRQFQGRQEHRALVDDHRSGNKESDKSKDELVLHGSF